MTAEYVLGLLDEKAALLCAIQKLESQRGILLGAVRDACELTDPRNPGCDPCKAHDALGGTLHYFCEVLKVVIP